MILRISVRSAALTQDGHMSFVLDALASYVLDRTSNVADSLSRGPTASVPQQAVFVPPTVRGPQGERTVAEWTTLGNEPRVLLYGDPGAGKTTLVNFVAHHMARAFLADHSGACPVLVAARTLPLSSGGAWEQLVAAGWPHGDKEAARNAIVAAAKDGRVHIFVDGFDELADHARRRQVADLLKAVLFEQPRLRMLVSSRPVAGPDSLAALLATWTLLPFSLDQAHALLSRLTNIQDGPAFTQLLGQKMLSSLTKNPLYLRLLASYIMIGSSEVPRSQARVFEDLTVALWVHERARFVGPTKPLSIEMFQRGMEVVAVALTSAGTATASTAMLERILNEDAFGLFDPAYTNTFLLYALERMVLLVKHGPDALGFEYRSFQEFYLGRALARDIAMLDRLPGTDLSEPLLFAAGLALDPVPAVLAAYRRYGVLLAAKCCAQPQQQQQPAQEALLRALLDDLGPELREPLRRLLPAVAETPPGIAEDEADDVFAELSELWVNLPREEASADARGRGLEQFAVTLFGGFFELVTVRHRHQVAEVDLICENHNVDPFWMPFGGDVWIECKNTSTKTSLEQVNVFLGKLSGTRHRLGFFLSTSGFTKDAIARLRQAGSSANSPLVAPISGEDVEVLLARRMEFQRFFKDRIRLVA